MSMKIIQSSFTFTQINFLVFTSFALVQNHLKIQWENCMLAK